MPTNKPRISMTVTSDEKYKIEQVAETYSMSSAAFCTYCVRLFLDNYDGGALPALSREYNAQLAMKFDDN